MLQYVFTSIYKSGSIKKENVSTKFKKSIEINCERGENMKQNKVYEIRLKIFLLRDIPVIKIMGEEAEFIDSALAKDSKWLEYHEKNCLKNYCMGGLYPIEKDGVYKKEEIYTITIRTVDVELAKYFSKELRNHYTESIKGLTLENRILPKKFISEIYTLTPVIMKTDKGYWRDQISINEFERLLVENLIKKYNQYTGEKIDEDFQLYTGLTFMNRKPVKVEYKGIHLLGDKVNLKISDDVRAQELAYVLLGTGIGTMNARGYGYCNYRWL